MQTLPHEDVFRIKQPDETVVVFDELSIHLKDLDSADTLAVLCYDEALL